MEKEKWNFPGWFNKQNFDWFMWNCRKSFNVIAAVLYKCIRVTAQFLLPALFEEEQLTNKTEQDSYITDSCVVGKKPEQEEGNDPDNIPGIIYQDLSDDEDEDRRDNGLIEGIENLNNQYPGIPNEQPADNALRRRHHHIVENPNKKPNAGEHIQPLQIANHQRQEDDQDVVADGPDPLPHAVQIEPNTARAQGRRPHFLENPNNIPNDGEHNQPFQIAGNVLLEDDQDVVADGPERVQGSRVFCPPEASREEPNAGEQNQPVENDVNRIQRGGVQEVDKEPEAPCLPPQIERQITRVQVNRDQCTHLIKDVSYNDMDDLSDVLDEGAILDVMKTLISIKEFEHIWSSCHGGSDPPMNLLFHLAGQNCKLSDLRKFALSDKGGRFSDLINLIDAHTGVDRDCMEKRLDELDFRLLSRIAELIRARPFPQKRPLWKRLACYAGLDEASITALDAPATGERKSLTMAFLKRISHTNPGEKVAWLASGLYANDLKDILADDDIEIFKKCRLHCINIV